MENRIISGEWKYSEYITELCHLGMHYNDKVTFVMNKKTVVASAKYYRGEVLSAEADSVIGALKLLCELFLEIKRLDK